MLLFLATFPHCFKFTCASDNTSISAVRPVCLWLRCSGTKYSATLHSTWFLLSELNFETKSVVYQPVNAAVELFSASGLNFLFLFFIDWHSVLHAWLRHAKGRDFENLPILRESSVPRKNYAGLGGNAVSHNVLPMKCAPGMNFSCVCFCIGILRFRNVSYLSWNYGAPHVIC